MLLRRTAAEEQEIARNTRLGVMNGGLFSLADALSDSYLVLTVFIRQLGASTTLIGLLPALRNGGWLLPQLTMAGRLQARPYKLPTYRRSGIVRFAMWSLLTALVWLAPQLPVGVVLALFLVLYAAYNLAAGVGALPFQDVVAKTIPARRRGHYFGMRNLIGGLLGFVVAGPVIAWVLGASSPLAFPASFGLLVAASLLFIGPGITAFSLIREPPTVDPPPPVGAWGMVAAVPRLLRADPDFRRFIVARLITRLGSLADPFYIIYAREVLGVPDRMIGIYLAVRTLAAALSNIYWARVADRHGNRRLLLLTGILIAGVPLWALLLPLAVPLLGREVAGWAFGGVFLLFGLSIDGSGTAGMTYVMEIAPASQRPVYLGVANTLLGVITLMSVLAGTLVEWIGFVPVFALAAACAGLGLALSWRLPEPRLTRAGEGG